MVSRANHDYPGIGGHISSFASSAEMYDVLFNTQYEEDPSFPNTTTLSPDTPRPEIRHLVLPYRY